MKLEINEQIVEQLRLIEEEEQVRIIYACDPAAGHGDSHLKIAIMMCDFSISAKRIGNCLIFERRDVIQRPISDMLDINGWDIRL